MRLSPIPSLDPQQQDLLEEITGRREDPPKSFVMWAHNLDVAPLFEELAKYCRTRTRFPQRLRVLSMLIVGRHFDCPSMWNAHHGQALDLGIDAEALRQLALGGVPRFSQHDEQLFFAFAHELLAERSVSDATYAAALEEFGEAALIDLVASLGAFGMSCLALTAFHVVNRPEDGLPFTDVPARIAALFDTGQDASA